MENLPADDPFAGAILSHLKVDSTIINDGHFENGIRKIQSGNESDLSPEEVEAVKMFKKPLPLPFSVIHSPTANEYASSLRNTLRAEKFYNALKILSTAKQITSLPLQIFASGSIVMPGVLCLLCAEAWTQTPSSFSFFSSTTESFGSQRVPLILL